MRDLHGKVVLVTGGSRGIGAATAKRLAADGARVLVNYARSAQAADAVVNEIRAAGGKADPLPGDLSDLDRALNLINEVVALAGRLDILVNNAAIFEGGNLDQIDPGQYARQFDLNVRAPLLLSKAAAAVMGEGGRIINLSSGLGSIPAPGNSIYGATKAAIESFTRSHAVELGPKGITVNCVAPGTTDTEMLRSGMTEATIARLKKLTPLGRLGTPEDIADVIAFLTSDQARWVTGQVLAASGGLR
jgi:3-oxoacyl-[acyl-carrier protein] reductase